MTLRIDKAGRIILPKPMRERLGLQAGSALEIEDTQGGVFLKPCEQTPALAKKDGFWVYTGELPRGFDIRRVIEKSGCGRCGHLKHGAPLLRHLRLDNGAIDHGCWGAMELVEGGGKLLQPFAFAGHNSGYRNRLRYVTVMP